MVGASEALPKAKRRGPPRGRCIGAFCDHASPPLLLLLLLLVSTFVAFVCPAHAQSWDTQSVSGAAHRGSSRSVLQQQQQQQQQQQGDPELPHVDDCYFCTQCHYAKDKRPDARPTVQRKIGGAEHEGQGAAGAQRVVPLQDEWEVKRKKPNCTECWGCSTELQPLKAMQAFGHKFAIEVGASPEWLFYADLPDTHLTGERAIVKVFCLPIDKISGQYRACSSRDVAVRGAQHLVALDRVTHDCGMTDITIRVWLAPVNAIMPGVGMHIWWYGLWMERAPGLSLNQLAYLGRKDLVENMIMSLLQDKMNKTQVVRAAIYDLLIAQCDRHAQNVFINEAGNLKLIDNLNSLRFSWKHCSQDSIFLLGTQKNEIVRWGGVLVSKRLNGKRRRTLNPLVLMDYRCYTEGGEIGTKYPPELVKCMRKISAMSAEELRQTYGFTEARIAHVLLTRAKDMLSKGYEWTLQQGKPLNHAPLRYKWHQACCKLALTSNHALQCGHKWDIKPEFPRGDPLVGGAWSYTYPDPGTYDGDAIWGPTDRSNDAPPANGTDAGLSPPPPAR